jgi:prepilin-type processing-associated H-X9-DG protein
MAAPFTVTYSFDGGSQGATGSGYGSVAYRATGINGSANSIFTWYESIGNPKGKVQIQSNHDKSNTPPGTIRYRQANQTAANLGFVDGHAQTMPLGSVLNKQINVEKQY